MRYRQATADDQPRIARDLLVPAYEAAEEREPEYSNLTDQARTDPDISYWLEEDDRVLFVAETDSGDLAGNVSGAVSPTPPIYDRPPAVYCDGLYVKPEYRRAGVATDLLDRLVAWGRERDCGFFSLSVHVDNDGGKAFFEDYGMTQQYHSMRMQL
ncbi:GNAT family N-acetyltransferase [Haloarchaeobius amylolyticus]|uniref:GNAT family N-acetyltransferase n=1 Tax=Haloarchaeobius amylolyticus TaxID=1198296 RepID=UPI00226F163C|nr:GNAT family N-acetyltransferase [Haloarchaeobius amylolyticus]